MNCLICQESVDLIDPQVELDDHVRIRSGRAHEDCIAEQSRMHRLVPRLVAQVTRVVDNEPITNEPILPPRIGRPTSL